MFTFKWAETRIDKRNSRAIEALKRRQTSATGLGKVAPTWRRSSCARDSNSPNIGHTLSASGEDLFDRRRHELM